MAGGKSAKGKSMPQARAWRGAGLARRGLGAARAWRAAGLARRGFGAPRQARWAKKIKKEANLYTFRFFSFGFSPFSGSWSESQKNNANLYTKMPILYTNSL
ncbi:MAG: hypothetical protein WCQ41_06770 [Bacillota bacterium]